MKTNKRVKRVKKTRRNRRSRRTQRGGGGKFGESIKLHASRLQECNRKCDRDNPDPLTKYTPENPTSSGWYITAGHVPFSGYSPTYEIKNTSIGFVCTNENRLYQDYLSVLEELPDPTKTYTTGGFFSKNKEWRLKYNHAASSLEWENQKDKTIIPFVIQSPLNIGDQMAKQSE